MKSISSLSDIYNLVVENYVREYNTSASAREIWLDTLEPVEMNGNVVILATDIDFKLNTLNDIYRARLEEQFENVIGYPITIQFIVQSDAPTNESRMNSAKNDEEITSQIDNIVNDNKVTYTFDNFIVGPSNNLAFAAAKAVSQKQHESIPLIPLWWVRATNLRMRRLWGLPLRPAKNTIRCLFTAIPVWERHIFCPRFRTRWRRNTPVST